MLLMVQRAPDDPVSRLSHIQLQSNLPYTRPFSLPGAFTIVEEPEDLSLSRPASSSNDTLRSKATINHPNAFNNRSTSSNAQKSRQMMQNSLQTPDLVFNDDNNSSLFLHEQRTPTTAMLANEREANMRTPRPHSAAPITSSGNFSETSNNNNRSNSTTSNTKARILQWQQRRDASDATVEADENSNKKFAPTTTSAIATPIPTLTGSELTKSAPPETNSYPTDSLGRISTHSSIYASGSEFGHSLRVGSESGHQSNSAAAAMLRKGRKIAPPELLVVVRPPPSKQGNPLNLQIQLVTPNQGPSNGGGGGGRISGESSRDELPSANTSGSLTADSAGEPNGTSIRTKNNSSSPPTLRRSNSVTSSRSAYSESSSAGLSTASTSSGARRVTPLYNLNFHSLMPTTVNDAGTDQKVAKFGKKYVDIDGFGQLVPHELAMGINDLASMSRRRRSFVSTSPSGRADSGSGASDFNSPTEVRSDISQTRSTGATTMHSDVESGSGSGVQMNAEPPTSFDAMSPQAKEAPMDPITGLGNKLIRGFKRFNVTAPITQVSPIKGNQSIRSGTTLDSNRTPASILSRMRGATNKVKENESTAPSSHTEDIESVTDHQNNFDNESDIPQLIVGAGLKSDGYRRTQGYYWTVRKWNRRLGENVEEDVDDLVPGRRDPGVNPILNSVWKRFNVANRMGGTEIHPPAVQIPVRFEWTRNEVRKKGSLSNGQGHGRAATDIGSQVSRRGSIAQARRASKNISRTDLENSTLPQESGGVEAGLKLPQKSNSRPSSVYGASSTPGGGGGSGTGIAIPFRRSMDRSSVLSGGACEEEESDPEDSETKWACHLVLGPTTRIPIGSLAPTPHHPKLVAQLTVPYPLPDLSQSGLGADGAGLTREELKDIISVTALFVIVREAFGGLAKRRKGDSVIKFGAASAQR